jgi:hypothetical protein
LSLVTLPASLKESLDRRFQIILDYYAYWNNGRNMVARNFTVGGYLFEGGDQPWSRAKTFIRRNTGEFVLRPRMAPPGKAKSISA